MPTATDIEILLRDAPLPLIASRARKARKTAGLSHDQLGKECGMYRANLIKLEKGRHRPRLSTLERIASATGRDVRWFLVEEADANPFPDDETAGAD